MLILDRSSPIRFLKALKLEKDKRILVILPDEIASRNFSYAALSEGLPADDFQTITLKELADNILYNVQTRPPRMLEKSILAHLIIEIINESSLEPLTPLKSLPLENPDVQNSLLDEFDEYLGATDAVSLHKYLLARAKEIKDPFARNNSLQTLEAFKTLEELLLENVAPLGSSVFLSRSHLVKSAGEKLPAGWPSTLSNIQEIIIASISVFDANALKFIMKIVETGESSENRFSVRIFQGSGTYERLATRLTKAGVKLGEEGERDFPRSPIAAAILAGNSSPSPQFISAPERRREVDAVAKRVHKLLLEGVHPSEILLVARNSSRYLSLMDEVLPAYGIASYVQTRRPYTHLCPYRFTKATIDLISKVSQSAELDWNDITDPLRLGFCLPGGGRAWPLGSKEFIYLEESLSLMQQRMRRQGISRELSEWKTKANSLRWGTPRKLLLEFLEWIEKQARLQPTRPEDVKVFISRLLGAYMYQHSTWRRESVSLRLQNPGRFVVSDLHPTWFATRIRNELSGFAAYLKDCVDTLNLSINWSTIATSFGEVFGSRTYGLPGQDASAIKMVDAGNTSFLKAKHLFLMGLQADEFPRVCPKGIFLPEELRKVVDTPAEGEAAYLYLRGPSSDYDNEIDFLELSLKTCQENVTCSMAYLDERGHVQEWSIFVDKFKPEKDEKSRIPPHDWLPQPMNDDWKGLATDNPPWIRRRLFCYHANRQFPYNPPSIDKKGVEELGSTIDPTFFSRILAGRIERYLTPPREIVVSHGEPWFSACSLDEITGSPLRTHEIDLHANCPLQFYFFQFLFLWDGDGIDRDTIPMYFKRPHWKLGRLPKRLSYIYPSNQTSKTIAKLVDTWPRRQEDLGSYQDSRELRESLASLLSGFDLTRFESVVNDELSLVQQEKRDNIARDWKYVPSGLKMQIALENEEVEIVLPSHRIDTLQGCELIVSHVNFSHQLRRIYNGKKKVGRNYKLFDVKDPLPDYRLPILVSYYASKEKVAGGVYIEFFEGTRLGYYSQPWLSKHKGRPGYGEELRVPYHRFGESLRQVLTNLEWNKWLRQVRVAISQRIGQLLPAPDATFIVSPSPDRCQRCVYNNLCQIPAAEGM